MGPYKGDYPTGFAPPLVFMFSTFSSDDPSASVANSGIAVTDIEIYKNGVATTRASDAGYVLLDTDGIDFDGKVGIGGSSIDIDNDTDAGFFAAGQEYDVVLASITVDAATINFHAGSFSIERAGGALALLKGTNSLSDIEGKVDTVQTDLDNATDGLGALKTLIDAVPTVAEIQAEIEENGASVIDTIRDQIGTAGAALTDLGGMSTGMKSEVESEANDALVAQKLDHLVAVADGDDPVNNSIIAKLADLGATADWSAYVNTTDSLRALRDRGDAAWITATGFNTTVPDAAGTAPTAVEIQAEMEENGASVLDTIRDDLDNVTDGLGALKALLDTLVTGVVVKTMNTDVNDAVSVDADVWAEVLDLANGVDTGLTLRQFFRLVAAATFGKASGLATTSAKYRNIPDDVDAITATVDADGNRSAVTLDSS